MMGPAWGYSACGRARVFDDGVLPEGWHPVPVVPMTAEEATRAHECEVRERRSVLFPTGDKTEPVLEPAGNKIETMPEDAAEPTPRKRGRPRKVA